MNSISNNNILGSKQNPLEMAIRRDITFLLIVLLSSGFCPFSSLASAPSSLSAFDVLIGKKGCTIGFTTTLNCDGLDLELENPPAGIEFPPEIEYADFRNNKITSLSTGDFVSGENVKALYFANNHIILISPNTFVNLTSLVTLDLSHNDIFELPQEAFNGLQRLTIIDLGYNRLHTLDPTVFFQREEKFQLKELKLNHNELKELNESSFKYLVHMDALDLEDNVLEDLPDTIFRSNSRLRDLKLAMNHFSRVPNAALRSAKVLSILDLSSNRFKEITYRDFSRLTTLTKLRLSRVQPLERIREHAFQDLVNLRLLYIEYNRKLREIHSRAFYNNVTHDTLCELTEVSLKGNGLTTLSADALSWGQITDLDFSDNPWRCDCHLKWIVNMTIKEGIEDTFLCKKPYKHFNQQIKSMTEDDFTCSFFENDAIVVGVVLLMVLAATGITSIGFVIVKLSLHTKIAQFISPKKKVLSNYVRVVPAKDTVDLEWDHSETVNSDPSPSFPTKV